MKRNKKTGISGSIKRRYKISKELLMRRRAKCRHNLLNKSKSAANKLKMKSISLAEKAGLNRKGRSL